MRYLPLKILIPIKQVPETSSVKIDETSGTMIREGTESIVNPLDLYAIEAGLKLKEEYGGSITVISMGPQTAEKVIKEAVSMGCDNGMLLTGKEFAGSDTWATSYTISETIRNLSDYDLIICGERATDGDTGQVGPGIASMLDVPLATYVSRIESADAGYIVVERLIETGYEKLRLKLPALITVTKEIGSPRLPTLRGKQRAKVTSIPNLSAESAGIDKSKIGLNASPTRVSKIETPKITREGKVIKVSSDSESISEACDELVKFLKKIGVIV
jgi:electron transfer flavoprotein beta subunit